MPPDTENFNSDELEAPQWLNADLFTKVLRKSENNTEIEVSNVKLSPGTGKGDHYASVMFRAVVDYQKQGKEYTKSLIVKTMPDVEGLKKEMLKESHIFETEIGVYTEVIPKFEKILRDVGDDTVLGARCLYHSLSPKKLIVFEDICPQGYIVLRDREVNVEEVKAAYLKLAKWHAISYKLNAEDPKLLDKYRHSMMTVSNMIENDFFTGGTKKFIEMLNVVPSLRKYKSHFEKLEPILFDKVMATFKEYRDNPQKNALYVLCHGDFHYKNMMFKHNQESGKFEDVMLLDFQLTYIGPIVNDLIYSFVMLLTPLQRINNFDELLYSYFSNFLETLKNIGFVGRLPKLAELREQLWQHRHFEIFLLVTFLPMWYAFSSGDMDTDEMVASEEYRKGFYQNKKFIEEMHLLLPKMLHLGYFEN